MNLKLISLFCPKPEPYTGQDVTKQKLVFAWLPKYLIHYRTEKKVLVWLRYVFIECKLKSVAYYYQSNSGNGLFFSLDENSQRLRNTLNKNYFLHCIEKYAKGNVFLSYRWRNSKWYEDLFEKIKSSLARS